jgi:hypothetical protein
MSPTTTIVLALVAGAVLAAAINYRLRLFTRRRR